MNLLTAFKQRLIYIWQAFTKPVPEDIASKSNSQSSKNFRDNRVNNRVNAKEGTRVLVVDDSKTVVGFLSKLLRQNGYQVIEAFDAETGLQLAQSEQPDLIFLDIVLPGQNGFAALRQLRRDPELANVPVIMMSGNIQATEEFYMQSIGADDFLKKPFSRAEVCTRVEQLLDADLIPCRQARIKTKVQMA